MRVLFVCLGNICRSPTAEGVVRQRLEEHGLADRVVLDSCGTGPWHVGEPPDARAQQAARKRLANKQADLEQVLRKLQQAEQELGQRLLQEMTPVVVP